MSLVNYSQLLMLMCRRYRASYCASMGVTLMKGLKLREFVIRSNNLLGVYLRWFLSIYGELI